MNSLHELCIQNIEISHTCQNKKTRISFTIKFENIDFGGHCGLNLTGSGRDISRQIAVMRLLSAFSIMRLDSDTISG